MKKNSILLLVGIVIGAIIGIVGYNFVPVYGQEAVINGNELSALRPGETFTYQQFIDRRFRAEDIDVINNGNSSVTEKSIKYPVKVTKIEKVNDEQYRVVESELDISISLEHYAFCRQGGQTKNECLVINDYMQSLAVQELKKRSVEYIESYQKNEMILKYKDEL